MRRIVVVGLAGLVLAVGLGLATHLIVRDTVGLPATSLGPMAPLAPPQAESPAAPRARQPSPTRPATTAPGTPTRPGTTAAAPTLTDGDDDGRGRGRGRNRGRGGDSDAGGNSGSGGSRDD